MLPGGPRPNIDTREELINALQEAIQIEHGLMLQYLFAAFSCKRRPDEGLTEEEVELVRQWERNLLGIARDEMAHLATACNLISAIGGAPDFNRPNFPQLEHRWFPFGFHLERLSIESLERFVCAESPAPQETMQEGIAPEPINFDFVGELYGLISQGFRNLVPDLRGRPDPDKERELFIGSAETQDSSGWSGGLSVMPIRGRIAAEEAIKFIVLEGEGTPENRQNSHFDRFSRIREELQAIITAKPDFSPSRDVSKNPMTRRHRDAPGDISLIEEETVAHDVAELFNHAYASMLMLLLQFFDPAGETIIQREAVRDSARRAMSGILRPMAEILTELPAQTTGAGMAGAPFELYGPLRLPANVDARLTVVAERMEIEAAEARRIASEKSAAAVGRLGFIAANIEQMSVTLRSLRSKQT